MFKSEFDLYQSRQLLHKKDSNQWAKSTIARDYFTSSNSNVRTNRNQWHSQKNPVRIDQLYVALEKQFNNHYTEQLKRNQYKFNTHYYRALEKFGEKRTVVSEKKKVFETEYLSNPVAYKSTRHQVVEYGTNQSLKSQLSIFEQTFNKTPEKEQSTQVSVQPLRFRHNIQQNRTPKRKMLQMKDFDQIEDNPSSGRTIIKDLEELIIQRDDKR